jgi:hypothetical protein
VRNRRSASPEDVALDLGPEFLELIDEAGRRSGDAILILHGRRYSSSLAGRIEASLSSTSSLNKNFGDRGHNLENLGKGSGLENLLFCLDPPMAEELKK